MPHGRPPALNALQVLAKSHRLDVLKALSNATGGLAYAQIQYEVVKTSGTNLVLDELVHFGFVAYKDETASYTITPAGRRVISLAEALSATGNVPA
jgi:DNA-binding HxlR family transcriptional regulator